MDRGAQPDGRWRSDGRAFAMLTVRIDARLIMMLGACWRECPGRAPDDFASMSVGIRGRNELGIVADWSANLKMDGLPPHLREGQLAFGRDGSTFGSSRS